MIEELNWEVYNMKLCEVLEEGKTYKNVDVVMQNEVSLNQRAEFVLLKEVSKVSATPNSMRIYVK